jgi:glycine/D-amino acid oxidase-like deaminating enzyme
MGSRGSGVRTSALTSSVKLEVAVVGAGISGPFLVHTLSRRYDNVAVIDRRPPISGATCASTALLQFEIDEPLSRLANKIGPANAALAWKRSFRATQTSFK